MSLLTFIHAPFWVIMQNREQIGSAGMGFGSKSEGETAAVVSGLLDFDIGCSIL